MPNTQQDDVYAAERTAFAPSGLHKDFDTIADIQSYVDNLTDSWWWPTFYPMVERVMVDASDDITSYAAIASVKSVNPIGEIRMHPMQFTIKTVAHELAHVFAHRLHQSASHDPWFARERLVTAYCMQGADAYVDLYAAFIRHGVEVAGGVHTLTDERIVL